MAQQKHVIQLLFHEEGESSAAFVVEPALPKLAEAGSQAVH